MTAKRSLGDGTPKGSLGSPDLPRQLLQIIHQLNTIGRCSYGR